MIKEIALLGFGVAMRDPKGRKVMWTIAKNSGTMLIEQLEKDTGVKIGDTMAKLLNEDNRPDVKVVNKTEVIEKEICKDV